MMTKNVLTYMWLDYGEYEIYHVIPGKDGHLTISGGGEDDIS